jgi:hypothetical protein
MEKVYQLLHAILFSTINIILINLLGSACNQNCENNNLSSLNTQPAIFLKNIIPNFYCLQTKLCL